MFLLKTFLQFFKILRSSTSLHFRMFLPLQIKNIEEICAKLTWLTCGFISVSSL